MINESQRKQRRMHIGASDCASLFGVDPYRSAYDIYLSKIYNLKDDSPSLSAQVGNELESIIVHWLSHRYKFQYTIEPEKLLMKHPTNDILECNVDAHVLDFPCDVEVKFTKMRRLWGETDTEDIPMFYYLQCQFQLMCTGNPYQLIGVFIANDMYFIEDRFIEGLKIMKEKLELDEIIEVMKMFFEMRCYAIKRDEKKIKQIESYCAWFYNHHVVNKIPPEVDELPSIDVFKRIPKLSGKIIDISSDAWQTFTEAKEVARLAGKAKDQAMSKVRAELGDASCGRVPGEENMFYGTVNGRTRTFKGTK